MDGRFAEWADASWNTIGRVRRTRASPRPRLKGVCGMKTLRGRCAGLDVHKVEVVACLRRVDRRKVEREVRRFPTTTRGLLELGDWLERGGCTHVAMEATGVYWKPVWHILGWDLYGAGGEEIRRPTNSSSPLAPKGPKASRPRLHRKAYTSRIVEIICLFYRNHHQGPSRQRWPLPRRHHHRRAAR